MNSKSWAFENGSQGDLDGVRCFISLMNVPSLLGLSLLFEKLRLLFAIILCPIQTADSSLINKMLKILFKVVLYEIVNVNCSTKWTMMNFYLLESKNFEAIISGDILSSSSVVSNLCSTEGKNSSLLLIRRSEIYAQIWTMLATGRLWCNMRYTAVMGDILLL